MYDFRIFWKVVIYGISWCRISSTRHSSLVAEERSFDGEHPRVRPRRVERARRDPRSEACSLGAVVVRRREGAGAVTGRAAAMGKKGRNSLITASVSFGIVSYFFFILFRHTLHTLSPP